MLTPKSAGEPFRRSPDRDPDRRERRPHPEARSFAPREGGRGPRWDARAVWPDAWSRIDPESFIWTSAELVDRPAEAVSRDLAETRALIVIPCLNEAAVIEGVIGRLLEDEGLVDPLVLVADGGSTDGTRQIVADIAARDPRVRLMANPGRLQSAGVNLAVRLLGEDRPWVVRVDAHADYPKDYVSTLVAEARRVGAHSVVVAMDTRGEAGFQQAVAAAQNSRLGTGGAAHRVGAEAGWVDHGHHALFSREAFQAIGGYDESFSHNEDAELDLRLAQAGGRIWLTDRTRIVYHPRATPGALARQYFSYGKGRARTVLKHATPLKFRQAIPLAIAPAMLSLLAAPLFWPLAIPALVWMAAALGYGTLLALKARDPVVALSGPAAMIMHLAWSAGFWAQLFRALAARLGPAQPPRPEVARVAP